MTITTRRIIYIIFILIFLLAAPVILLYTAGYNYNFKKGSFLKTGVLLVDAKPSDAYFLIDRQEYNLSLPARLSNLKPKDYTVTIKRDGYYDWEKTLSLDSGQTVFATNIFLPKKSEPRLLTEANISQAIFLEKGNQFILVIRDTKTSKIILFDAISKQGTVLIDALAEKNPMLTVSPNEKYVLVETARQTMAISLSKPSASLLLQGKTGPLRKVIFETDNDFVVYGLDGSSLWRRNLITAEQRALYTVTGKDFLVRDGFLYWTGGKNTELFTLWRVAIFVGNQEAPKPIINLPRGDYRLEPIGKYILANELNTHRFSIIDPEKRKALLEGDLRDITMRDRSSTVLSSLPKGSSLIYWNTSEIWLSDINDLNPRLITRIGEPIVKAIELPKQPYVLFATTRGLSLIEEDNRNNKNAYSLVGNTNIRDLFLFNDAFAYFVNDRGLFSLALQ